MAPEGRYDDSEDSASREDAVKGESVRNSGRGILLNYCRHFVTDSKMMFESSTSHETTRYVVVDVDDGGQHDRDVDAGITRVSSHG